MPDQTVRSAGADGFAELLLTDPEWVRAEFDAIVAANFAPPPAAPRAARPPRPPARAHRPPARVRRPVVKCPRRERSPPEADSDGHREPRKG